MQGSYLKLLMGWESVGLWVDDYSPELGIYVARCEFLKPGWLDRRQRIIDIVESRPTLRTAPHHHIVHIDV